MKVADVADKEVLVATITTPAYYAPHNGIVGDASATAGAGQINQFLGTHAVQAIYQGNPVLTPNGTGGASWGQQLSTVDVDQPFTMSGTTIGRIAAPLLSVGNGADLLVSLWTDSGGSPGSVVNQARIPAAWIYQLAAASNASQPSATTPSPTTTANPLGVAQFNGWRLGPWSAAMPWTGPSVGSSVLYPSSFTSAGNYLISAGGTNSSNAVINNVFTYAFNGSASLGLPTPQPSLPAALFSNAIAATSSTVIVLGGTTSTTVSTVYTASWDSSTGTIGAWSQQASLPQAVASTTNGAATWNDTTVYLVGGQNSAGTDLNTVYWATISNGQINSWNTGTPLPIAASFPNVFVIGNFLCVTGGSLSGSLPASAATYYAPINTDGSLGGWQPGPSSPVPTSLTVSVGNGVLSIGGYTNPLYSPTQDLMSWTIDSTGPGSWTRQTYPGTLPDPTTSVAMQGAFETSATTWQVFVLSQSSYVTATLAYTPMITVALPTTGLTNGSTYHVTLQQQGGDLNDYLVTHLDLNAFTGNPTAKTSPRGTYMWSSLTPSGTCIPVQVFDQTVGGPALHLWADNSARITTIVSATTPDQRILGVCEATRQAYAQNANTGFETGIVPWTCTGGTVAQSSTQVFEGSHSAQVTPSGSASVVYLQSELLPCMPGQSITVTGPMWFTNAVTSNASMSVNWYALDGTYISTSFNNVSAPAAAWTQLTNPFTAPGDAYQFTINPTLSGTPPSSQVFYVDSCYAYPTSAGPQNATVSQITASGTWPAITTPTGVVPLA